MAAGYISLLFSAEEIPYVLDTTYKCSYTDGSTRLEDLSDKFFLLSLVEVGANETSYGYNAKYMEENEGVKLEYFDDTQRESETRATRGYWKNNWWLRSVFVRYGASNCLVNMQTGLIQDRNSPGYTAFIRPACNINSYTPVVESQDHPGYYEIYQPVLESVSLNQDSASMTVGEKLKLEPAFHGAGGAPVPTEEQGVTWTSSDPDVVMVDVNGNITALKEGTATITVTTDVGQKTAVCNVTVGHSPVKTGVKRPPVPKREAGSITAAAAAASSSRMRRAQRRSQISTPGGSSRRWTTASQTMSTTMTLPVRQTERKRQNATDAMRPTPGKKQARRLDIRQ